jgi:hypothetical protein
MMALALAVSALSWLHAPYAPALRSTKSSRNVVRMKKAPDERPEERPQLNFDANSIVEFHDPKHGSGDQVPVLGLIQGIEFKAKGGARLQIVDANGNAHAVAEKAIHVNLGAYKGKLKEPAAILADYEGIMSLAPVELGVDPEDLEMAWELASETDEGSFSPKFVLQLIDDGFFKAPTDAYRAFRLLSSDLGKVFFKNLGGNHFKPKPKKAVQASKDNWCRELQEPQQEWCFV